MNENNGLPGEAPSTGAAVGDFFSTDEIFQRVSATANEEMSRPFRLMFLSGLAAGLSIGLSFYARAAITAEVPEAPLIGNLLYPIGFVLIVIGRYQLFTENTLTPVTQVLARIASLPALMKVWGIVLLANLVGSTLLAILLATTSIMSPEVQATAIGFWDHAAETSWSALFFKGIMAGWLVASMVWLVHAARDTITRLMLVFFMMYLIPSADLYHCIIGFCEAMYAVILGEATLGYAVFNFFAPVLLGNTIGGVLLVGILNFGMTRDTHFPEAGCGQLQLSWREWLTGYHTGIPATEEADAGDLHTPLSNDDHIRNPQEMGTTIVQYADFECPSSRRIYEIVKVIEEEIGTPVCYVLRHLPLSQRNPHAVRAAVAAEAAHAQGKFWEMADLLFANQGNLEEDDLRSYAAQLDLNIPAFEKAMERSELVDRVESQRRDGMSNEVRRAWNLFIDGERYVGEWEVEDILRVVQKKRKRHMATANSEAVPA